MSGLMDAFDADYSVAGHDARSMHSSRSRKTQAARYHETPSSTWPTPTMVAASKPPCLLRRTIPAVGLRTLSFEFRDRHFGILLALGVRKDNLKHHALVGRLKPQPYHRRTPGSS